MSTRAAEFGLWHNPKRLDQNQFRKVQSLEGFTRSPRVVSFLRGACFITMFSLLVKYAVGAFNEIWKIFYFPFKGRNIILKLSCFERKAGELQGMLTALFMYNPQVFVGKKRKAQALVLDN